MSGNVENTSASRVKGPRARAVLGLLTAGALLAGASLPAGSARAAQPEPSGTLAGLAPEVLPTAGSGTGREIRTLVSGLERKHRAHISVALLPVGSTGTPWTAGTFRTGPAWSTSKVPLAIAAQRKYPKGPLTAARMRAAITASDNAAAEAMWRSLGTPSRAAAATTRVIRDGGDRTTTVPAVRKRRGYTIFGQTAWTPANQVRFAASLPCRRDARTTLQLMSQVRADQRWGLGTIRGARFKGGWGPQTNGRYVVRQVGVVTVQGQKLGVVVAVSDVSFATGTKITTQLSRQVAATPPRLARPTRIC